MAQLLFALLTSGAINQIYGTIVVSLLIIIVWQYARKKRAYLLGTRSASFEALALFCFTYVFFGNRSIQGIEYYIVCPLLAFFAGWTAVESGKKNPAEIIKMSIYFMLIGYGIHALLNYSINIGHKRWELYDVFTGERRGATGSGCINTMILSLTTFFITLEKNKIYKVIGIILSAISLLYAFLLGTRAQFLILVIVTIVFLILYLHETYGRMAVVRLALVAAVLIGAYYYFYSSNKFGIRSYIEASNLIDRYSYTQDLTRADNYRWDSLARGLVNVFTHPFGGLKSIAFYHNMWLDVGRVSGVIPFAMLIFYTIVTNVHALKIFKDKNQPIWFRYLLLCVFLGIQMNFFMEPILEGVPDFFFVFLMINGMVECYYYQIWMRL